MFYIFDGDVNLDKRIILQRVGVADEGWLDISDLVFARSLEEDSAETK